MKKPNYKAEIYKDKKGEFRFRVIHKNGKIFFESSESYKSEKTLKKIWLKFLFYVSNSGDISGLFIKTLTGGTK